MFSFTKNASETSVKMLEIDLLLEFWAIYFTKLAWSLDSIEMEFKYQKWKWQKTILENLFVIFILTSRKIKRKLGCLCSDVKFLRYVHWWLIPKVVWKVSSLHLNTLVTGLKQTLHTQRHPISSISDISFTCPFQTQQYLLLCTIHHNQLSWARYKTELMLI